MDQVKVGVIGGSRLGELLAGRARGASHDVETPFGKTSSPIVEFDWEGLAVLFLSRHGPGHVLGPSQVPFRANVFALKKLGCTHVIASGAVGSLREEFKPRDLVIPDQIIDKTTRRAGTFFEDAAVHVDFAEPFCPALRRMLIEEGSAPAQGAASAQDTAPARDTATEVAAPAEIPISRVDGRGCYVCMEGPAFSTRAESHMHRLWGGDLIGMTAMPEAKLAREAGLAYALVAMVTDYDCWRQPAAVTQPDAPPRDVDELLKEIVANLRSASDNAAGLIGRVLRRIARDPSALTPSSAADALRLAVWTDKSRIPRDAVERLAPLWMKYFG